MTTYAGERITITHTASVEGVDLTDEDVNEVEIEIYGPDGSEVVALTEMTWDDTQERWEYVFVTEDLAPGTYRARVVIDDDNWEYKRIRLANNPDAFGIDPGD